MMCCQILEKNLSALTNFNGDGDNGAEKSDESDYSLQQTTSKIIEKEF